MKCPHCEEEIKGQECPHCFEEIPEESIFCMHCGQRVEEIEESAEGGGDWADRKLCSDGACIGVIGPDGKCKECGKPYTGEPTEDIESSAEDAGDDDDGDGDVEIEGK